MTTPMNTSKDFLTALQWLSPAFPIGSFAYSHGLEWAISAGHVTQEAELLEWVRDLVQFGSGRNDAFLVSLGYQAHDIQALRDLNAHALALSASRERQAETVFQGQAFVKTLKDVWGHDLPSLCYPVAVGAAARLEALPQVDIVAAYLHAFSANLISAAVRLIPLGQTQGQRVLLELTSSLLSVSNAALDADACALSSTTFLSDVASMRHENLQTRVFRT
jgi:urease accessory protein